MILRLGKIAVLICLFSLIGGHRASLQGIAWVNMVVDRAAEATSLPSLVLETVSGANPCALCLSIQNNTQENQPDPTEALLLKAGTIICSPLETVILNPPRPSTRFPFDDLRATSPPTPRIDRPPQAHPLIS